MRGHLEKRPHSDSWRLCVYVGRDPDGKRRYLRRAFHGPKREAENALTALLAEAGLGVPDADSTFRDLAERWYVMAKPSLSPSTWDEYRRLLDKLILPHVGAIKLRSLRASHLDHFYSELLSPPKPLSPMSVRHVHALTRRILNQGVKWGQLGVNPALQASPPKVRHKDIQPPDIAVVAEMIAKADPDLAVLLRVAAVTGARRGELCGLQWRDVDFSGSALTISRSVVGRRNDDIVVRGTKTGIVRRIALDASTMAVLREHRDHCDARASGTRATVGDGAFVFSPDIAGRKPWRPGGITLAVRRLRETAGLDVNILSLRHTAATQLLAAGVPVRTVAGRLGHADPSTTLRVYAQWLPESDRAAAEAMGNLLSPPQKK